MCEVRDDLCADLRHLNERSSDAGSVCDVSCSSWSRACDQAVRRRVRAVLGRPSGQAGGR